jgi:translation initiation factor 2 subunit 2
MGNETGKKIEMKTEIKTKIETDTEMKYDELLDRAIKKLPNVESTKDRFAMPQVAVEYSGSKTIVKNFSEVLLAIRRDSNHLSKFLFRELATAGSIQNQSLNFQGKIPKEKLQGKLEKYVKEFVFCKGCGEPDTKLVKEDRVTFIQCEACGCKYPVRNI